MRQLDEYPGTVACFWVRACCAAVGKAVQDLEPLPDDLVRRGPFYITDESDAARIMLESRIV
jgi:hypothetical protein